MYGLNKFMMDINIETLAGTTFSLKVSKHESVQSIKAKIQRLEGIPISHQHLVWQSNELDDKCSLNDYNVPNGATIRMVLALRGGPINTRRMTTEDTFIRDVSDLIEMPEDGNLWNNDSSTAQSINKHLTFYLLKDGDRFNLVRIFDQADAVSPTSGAMSAASMYVPLDDADGDAGASAAGAGAASSTAAAIEESLTEIINKSARLSKLLSAQSSTSRRRKSSSQTPGAASSLVTNSVSENKRTKEKMNAIKIKMSQKRAQMASSNTEPVIVVPPRPDGEKSNVNQEPVNPSKSSPTSVRAVKSVEVGTETTGTGNEEPLIDEYYDDDDDESDDDDPDEEDEDEYIEDDDDDCEDDDEGDEVEDDDDYDEEDDYDEDDSEQENSEEDEYDPEKYYERQLSVNPPSTADAMINGILTATGEDEEDEDGDQPGDNEDVLLNKSEFLLNELIGDSQSPLTGVDLMAFVMMTMSSATAAADQISLNGVSSSLATTALPTVVTPNYTDNEQYIVHRRRRRQRSPSSTAKKYLRARRKKNAQQQTGGGKSRKKTDNKEPADGVDSTQQQTDNQTNPDNAEQVDETTDVIKKPKFRKRKRLLNVVTATDPLLVKTGEVENGAEAAMVQPESQSLENKENQLSTEVAKKLSNTQRPHHHRHHVKSGTAMHHIATFSPTGILLRTISLENTRRIIKESNERHLRRLESLENNLIKRLAEANNSQEPSKEANQTEAAAPVETAPVQVEKVEEAQLPVKPDETPLKPGSSNHTKRVSFTVNEANVAGLSQDGVDKTANIEESNRRSSAHFQQLRPLIITNYRQKPPPKLDSLYINNNPNEAINHSTQISKQSTENSSSVATRSGLLSARGLRGTELSQSQPHGNKLETLKNQIGTTSILRPYQQISISNHPSTNSKSSIDSQQAADQQSSRVEISRIYSGSRNRTIGRQFSISSQDLNTAPIPSSHNQQSALKLPPVVTNHRPPSSTANPNAGLLIGGSVNNLNGISLSEQIGSKKKQPTDLSRCCHFCKKKTGLASSYMCRCGNNYCTQHRNAEAHMCTYDYKTEGRKLIEQTNPLVAAPKLPKI